MMMIIIKDLIIKWMISLIELDVINDGHEIIMKVMTFIEMSSSVQKRARNTF